MNLRSKSRRFKRRKSRSKGNINKSRIRKMAIQKAKEKTLADETEKARIAALKQAEL